MPGTLRVQCGTLYRALDGDEIDMAECEPGTNGRQDPAGARSDTAKTVNMASTLLLRTMVDVHTPCARR
jgi:hypothetical protein